MRESELFEDIARKISRRDMLKLSALGGGAFLLNPLQAQEQQPQEPKHKSKAKIVIVGGGDAGTTIAARINNLLEGADITIIEPKETHYYQPGQTLIGGGVWKLEDIAYPFKEFVPAGVKWEKDSAASFDPDNNSLTLVSGKEVSYDYLVVATGLKLEYEKITGITQDTLGTSGVNSIYAQSGAVKTFPAIQELAKMAKVKKVKALFTHPDTPIKCGGAPKKIMNLTEHYLREEGVRDNVEISFLPNGGKYFGIPEYNTVVKKQFDAKGLDAKFRHNLVGIDVKEQVASFKHTYEVKGDYDEDLQEYDMVTKSKQVDLEFDFIHVTPPMRAHDAVKNSKLAWQKGQNAKLGFVEVDDRTLQHRRYPNVFGAGDVVGTKYGKTGGSVRKQAPVVAQNLVALIKGQQMKAAYDGYTVCPLITGYGSVMLAEFNYEGITSSFPLDPTQERWLWWLLKVYALKPMYFHGMLKGRA